MYSTNRIRALHNNYTFVAKVIVELGDFAPNISASIDVTVDRFAALKLLLDAYPACSGAGCSNKTVLSPVA